jgi:hypothetical protein
MSKTEKTKSSTQHTRELDLHANRNEWRRTCASKQNATFPTQQICLLTQTTILQRHIASGQIQ